MDTADIDIPATLGQARLRAQADDVAGARALYEAVLTLHPDHMPAWRGMLDLELQQHRPQAVLDLGRNILERFPQLDIMVATKQATALDMLGRLGAAIERLLKARETAAEDVPSALLLAGLLIRRGALGRAEALYLGVLERVADHPGAWRGRINIRVQQDKPDKALALCAQALRVLPPEAHGVILTTQATVLEGMERFGEAEALVGQVLAQSPGDIQATMTLARLMQKAWRLDRADALFVQVLGVNDRLVAAWRGRIGVMSQNGDLDGALALCDTALDRITPPPRDLLEHKGQLLLAVNRPHEAALALADLYHAAPDRLSIALGLGQAHLESGALEAAKEVFAAARQRFPDEAGPLLGLIRVAEAGGDHAGALHQVRSVLARHGDGHAPDAPADLILKCCELQLHTGQDRDVAALLGVLADRADALPEKELLRVFELAERQTLSRVAVQVLHAVAARPALSYASALVVLKHVHVMGDDDLMRRLGSVLETRLPPSQQAEFRLQALAYTDGPQAALAAARADLPLPRTPKDANIIGRYLLEAGAAHVAVRYLYHAALKWPASRALRGLFVHACSPAGRHDLAHRYLDRMAVLYPDLDLGVERLRVLFNTGDMAGALALAETRRSKGLATLPPRQFLQICLASGDLDKAQAATRALRADPDSNSRTAAHFTASQVGWMLNDLRLYRQMVAYHDTAGTPAAAATEQLVQQFYCPAKSVVDDWVARCGMVGSPGVSGPDSGPDSDPNSDAVPVPRHIYQYWDTPTPPPEIAALIDSWKDVPGFEHSLFNRATAARFLRQNFGPRFIQAFNRARSAAEESDFFRLCCLFKHGGLYTDTDDKLVGDPEALMRLGSGLITAREPIGAVANNTLIAPPDHPIIKQALIFAMRSLLANESDGAWFKTGPGMLTRAIAVYLNRTPEAEARAALTLVSGDLLRQHIQPHIRLPYKTTVKYWNTHSRTLGKSVVDALTEMTGL